MKKLKQIFIVVICTSIASQIYFNFLIQGFTIAFSVVVFSIFLYNYVELNPIKTAIITGIITSFYKSLWLYPSIGNFAKTVKITTPEIIFYATYGVIFYFLYYKNRKRDLTKFMVSIFCCDFFSNIIEISIRTKIIGVSSNMIKDLLIIACVRSLMALIILIVMKHYKSFLIKEEHEERYRRLILMTSSFKSEIYFMNKNAAEIEDVMKKSFSVYEIVSGNHYPDELKNLTLDIAKDVHEIKKDYIRVMRGLEEISNDKIDVERMEIRDIINILQIDTKDYIGIRNLDIELDFKVECDFYVLEHFYLMSIIRNLIFNSIEAIDSKKRGLVKLKIEEVRDEYIFSVSDNGTGISHSNLDFIFNPGFSTKYDKETGSICRGIGLTLVRDLVQDIFKGSISVQSIENRSTIFTVKIPINLFGR
jgi:two-component system, sensor histidine kinase YcbA